MAKIFCPYDRCNRWLSGLSVGLEIPGYTLSQVRIRLAILLTTSICEDFFSASKKSDEPFLDNSVSKLEMEMESVDNRVSNGQMLELFLNRQ